MLTTTFQAFFPVNAASRALSDLYGQVWTNILEVMFMATPPADPVGMWSAQLGALFLKYEAPDGGTIPWSVIAMWSGRLWAYAIKGYTGSYRVELLGPTGVRLVVSLT